VFPHEVLHDSFVILGYPEFTMRTFTIALAGLMAAPSVDAGFALAAFATGQEDPGFFKVVNYEHSAIHRTGEPVECGGKRR